MDRQRRGAEALLHRNLALWWQPCSQPCRAFAATVRGHQPRQARIVCVGTEWWHHGLPEEIDAMEAVT